MPYPAGHRAATRERIIESARKLFNQHGFDGVSVRQIMAGAGLTHGGFYDYFQGKSDLYTHVLDCFFTDPNWKSRWDGVTVDLGSADVGGQIVRAYLSRQHYEDVAHSCPLVALPTDVRRSGKAVRSAFETVFLAMVRILEHSMGQPTAATHEKAQAVAALCVGGLVVARAMRNESVADELREACMTVALAHWSHDGGVKAERPAKKNPRRQRTPRRSQ